jgi:ubiquinone/menaquinone biosynthesis C-methylase UbiE
VSKERDLISQGIDSTGGVWADFGSGTGIFTLELRGLLGPTCEIFSIDRNGRDLERQRRAFAERYPDTNIHYIEADFTQPLDLPRLDGIVMANSLHYVPFHKQAAVLTQICSYLRWPGGRFIIVEYNAQAGNMWVPYPISIDAFLFMASQIGLHEARVLSVIPSRFLREMYSALAIRK